MIKLIAGSRKLWLLINVPGMRLKDARALVACGITEPEQLDTSHPHQLSERISRFFGTSEGRRFAGNEYGGTENAISIDRSTVGIVRWMQLAVVGKTEHVLV